MPRVVLVPGFTQTSVSWEPVAEGLRAAGHFVTALEVPDGLSFATTAAALGASGGRGVYVGYSMGGRLCLRLALDRPKVVERLVLVSASPGLADPDARAERRASDEALARDVERRGVEPFLRDWLAQPLFASLPPNASDLAGRAAGHTAAQLADTLRRLGTGTQEPLWDRLAELEMPIALVTGRADTKFEAINDAMARTCTASKSLRRAHLEGGHAVPLEQPAALTQFLNEWLSDTS